MSVSVNNATSAANTTDDFDYLYSPTIVIPITIVYAIIFLTGVIGNVTTCIVIAKNKSMHTATNFYLFSLAISDFLLLVSGLPPEMYRLWSPDVYVFGQVFCIMQSFAAETTANATVLTITAFTVERYLAICHPFLTQTMSKLSRAIRYIILIWFIALCLAAPQAIQFGVQVEKQNGVQHSTCTVVSNVLQHAFEISTFVFFVGPMTLITILYILIGLQLRNSSKIPMGKQQSIESRGSGARSSKAQKRVVKMLVAVVVSFFICWAPFQAQRLLAIYLITTASKEAQQETIIITIYVTLMHVSGVLYFLSTTINPVLYHIMSNKFREAFKKTFTDPCCSKNRQRQHSQNYTVLSRCQLAASRQHQKANLEERHEQINLNNASGRTCTTSINTKTDASKESSNNSHLDAIRSRMLKLFNKAPDYREQFIRQSSVVSHTISNSSLQDVEEMDYSSSDLVRYMEEVNDGIA